MTMLSEKVTIKQNNYGQPKPIASQVYVYNDCKCYGAGRMSDSLGITHAFNAFLLLAVTS